MTWLGPAAEDRQRSRYALDPALWIPFPLVRHWNKAGIATQPTPTDIRVGPIKLPHEGINKFL
jgi:hypothetical protein